MCLTAPKKPHTSIASGKFGASGKMVIKPFSIPAENRDRVVREFYKHIKIDLLGCWLWQGRTHNGYASMSYMGSTRWAHRVSYALFNGPIAAQMHIDHNCRCRTCVNPAHLEQMTPIENYEAVHRRKRRDEKKAQEENGQLKLFDY
jgi:hypothetical protein